MKKPNPETTEPQTNKYFFRSLLAGMHKYMQQPGVEKKYQEWLKQKQSDSAIRAK